ncbi:hypothetical protein F5I97DRAFT_1907559 [Phlebopus sp. FC_14]|nr:hypothetical protein F5I97DRAFT_1907559 [Phlebopus sp. FC_14]
MLGEADAKFPGQTGSGRPPSPTRENPGQVYPKSDPQGKSCIMHRSCASLSSLVILSAAPPATVPGSGEPPVTTSIIGNPYLLDSALNRLDSSLTDLISIISNEEAAVGSSSKELRFLEKFQSWKSELSDMRTSHGKYYLTSEEAAVSADEGGLFAD